MTIQVYDLFVPAEKADLLLAEKVWPKLQPHWSDKQVVRKELTGGYINKICAYYAAADTNMDDALVVRLFGNKGEGHPPSEVDFMKMQISQQAGTFPRIRAVLQNGVIYEYAKGRHLNASDLTDPTIVSKMAGALARLHWIDVSSCSLIDMRGNPTTIEIYDDSISRARILSEATQSGLPGVETKKSYGDMNMFQAMENEISFMESYLRDLDLPIVNGHSELNNNNIVYNEDTGTIMLLDYDLSWHGLPATFDLSYMFNGHILFEKLARISSSLKPDTDETKRMWMRVYLEKKYELEGRDPLTITETEMELWMTAMKITDVSFLVKLFAVCKALLAVDTGIPMLALVEVLCDTYFEKKPQLHALRKKYLRLKVSLD